MDPKERLSDPEEAFRTSVEGMLAGLWTALPCIVNSVNLGAMTVTLQPTIMGKRRHEDGTVEDIIMPLLVDVPIIYMGGGGYVATFPIAPGDEALAIFSSRCIDSWWQSGGIQTQAELRMHDLSDAFCLVGPRSQANLIPNVSSNTTQLRTVTGTTYAEITSGGNINLVAPTQVTITSPLAHFTGDITASGDITAGTISLRHHTHSGVIPGSGSTGQPVP